MIKEWLYFGCNRGPGHYIHSRGMRDYSGRNERDLSRFDGMLAPQDSTHPYIAVVTRLGGWGCSALSFWDYSVDTRGGSNSIIFAPSLDITEQDLLDGAIKNFPEVFSRLLQQVTLKGVK